MSDPQALQEAITFLHDRFPTQPSGNLIEIRTFDEAVFRRDERQQWFTSPEEAARHAITLSGRGDVYYGVNLRQGELGTKDGIQWVSVLHAELDDDKFERGRAGVLAASAAFPIPPSLLVDSGGGIHIYWLLVEPIAIIDRKADVARIERLLKRMYGRLGHACPVQDLSRVLRIPGTLNHKPAYGSPRPVRLIERYPERAYLLEEIEAVFPPEIRERPKQSVGGYPLAGPRSAGALTVDELRTMLRYIPPTGDYTEHWLATLMAIHDAYPGPEGVDLAEEWSPGKEGEVAKKFAGFTQGDGVTVGTLIAKAKLGGYRPPGDPVLTTHPERKGLPAAMMDAGELLDEYADLDVAELARQLASAMGEIVALKARVASLELELRQEHIERSLTAGVLRKTDLPPAERLSLLAAYQLHASSASVGKADDDGFVPVSPRALAELAGIPERTASRHLRCHAEAGLLDRRVDTERERILDKTTGEILGYAPRSKTWIRPPAESLQASLRVAKAADIPPRPRPGGNRPQCAEHPDAPTVTKWIETCSVCGKLLNKGIVEHAGRQSETPPPEDDTPAVGEQLARIVARAAVPSGHNGRTESTNKGMARPAWESTMDDTLLHPASGHNGRTQSAMFAPRDHDGVILAYDVSPLDAPPVVPLRTLAEGGAP